MIMQKNIGQKFVNYLGPKIFNTLNLNAKKKILKN